MDIKKIVQPCSLVYVLVGDPIPLARARHGRYTVYDSQKHHKLVLGLEIKKQHGACRFYEGPLHMDVTFFMQKPKAHKKKKYYHYVKPDLSNLIKFVEDICTNILYNDDCLIAYITAHKIYDDNPRTEFTIRELNGFSATL